MLAILLFAITLTPAEPPAWAGFFSPPPVVEPSPVPAGGDLAPHRYATRPELPRMALAIAACESGVRRKDGTAVLGTYDLEAENPTSSASGKYQFLSSTWSWVTGLEPPASAYPEHVQDAAFLQLYDHGRGLSHWAPSQSCWSRSN